MNKFGKNSARKLLTCHKDLQRILNLAVSRSLVDFGISEGHRSTSRQNKLFLEGKSRIDGVTRLGKHNYFPSQAVDIYIYTPLHKYKEKALYDKSHLSYVSGVIRSCAVELKEKGEVNCDIRWGGDWNSNGVLEFDQSFDDLPHFEIINIK